MSERRQQDTLPEEEYEEWLETLEKDEYCPHGFCRDGGKDCLECLVNGEWA